MRTLAVAKPRSIALVFAAVLGGCANRAATPERARVPPRTVVVLIVVDQLAGWIAEERLPLLPPDGGFARLARDGGGMRFLEHGHSVTDTAPGHAALFTGRLPRDHGIGANDIVDTEGRVVSILRDDSTRLVTSSGVTDRIGSSVRVLRVETLADRLRDRVRSARIVSLSLKDRGTLFGAGRHPDAAIYFDPALDAFVSSTAYVDALPEWARAVASDVPARRRAPWTLLDEGFVRAHSTTVDASPGEGDLGGFGTTFPHDYSRASRPGSAFRSSPASDVALIDLALAAADEYRDEHSPLLLTISLSANDYVGHVFGPSSWEAWDTLLRLDRELARLPDGLDARFGPRGYSVMLSADHGVFEMPEEDVAHAPWCGRPDPFERPCGRAYRVDSEALAIELERAARDELGDGRFVLGIADPYVRLTEPARSLPSTDRTRLVRRLIDTVRATSGFADALDTADPHACERVAHPEPAIFCAAIVPELGDVYLVPRSGAFYDSHYVPGFGSGHGSPYPYDRRVPLFVVPARAARNVAQLVGEPGSIRRFDTYFAIADRWLGGDRAP